MKKVEFIRELRAVTSEDESNMNCLRLRAAKEIADDMQANPEKWIEMIQSLAAQEEPQCKATFSTDICFTKETISLIQKEISKQ